MEKSTIIKELAQILREYRLNYHQVYAKGLRYVLTKKVELAHVEKESLTNSLWHISQHSVFIFIDEQKQLHAICTCPDYVFNISVIGEQKKRRLYCSHILASFTCLLGILGAPKEERIYDCDIKTAIDKDIKKLASNYLYQTLSIIIEAGKN